jgi:hypothetical protein
LNSWSIGTSDHLNTGIPTAPGVFLEVHERCAFGLALLLIEDHDAAFLTVALLAFDALGLLCCARGDLHNRRGSPPPGGHPFRA